MPFSATRCNLDCRAQLSLGLRRLPLLQQHPRQSQPCLYKLGRDLNRFSKMCHRRIHFPLLSQHPAQRRLGLRIIRSQPHRLLKFRARPRNITAFERLLPVLQRQSRRRFRRSSRRRLSQQCKVQSDDRREEKTNEPERVWEHDEWTMFYLSRIISNGRSALV